MEGQFILVAVKGDHHQPIFGPAIAKVTQQKRTDLKKSIEWKGWEIQMRNPESYKKHPILRKKEALIKKVLQIK